MGWGGTVIDNQDPTLAHENSEFKVAACEMLKGPMIEKDTD
jgi:hypothetical protein